jgi:hypothetical protein
MLRSLLRVLACWLAMMLPAWVAVLPFVLCLPTKHFAGSTNSSVLGARLRRISTLIGNNLLFSMPLALHRLVPSIAQRTSVVGKTIGSRQDNSRG